jgi:hypothetical protein
MDGGATVDVVASGNGWRRRRRDLIRSGMHTEVLLFKQPDSGQGYLRRHIIILIYCFKNNATRSVISK